MSTREATTEATGSLLPETNGTPAPYGRACANCSRAKCRCMYRLDGNDCERCHRLKKDCRPAVPVRRRAAATKKTALGLSRTAQLEQKLDGLVELLAAQNSMAASNLGTSGGNSNVNNSTGSQSKTRGQSPSMAINKARPTDRSLRKSILSRDGQSMTAPPSCADSPAGTFHLPLHLPRTPDSTSPSSAIMNATSAAMHMCPGHDRPEIASDEDQDLGLDPSIEPTEAEAEENLRTFRLGMLPYFPVVHIPEGAPATLLRRARPALWLAINCVACNSTTTTAIQFARSTHLRQLFAQRLMVESRKSVDLLLALLVFMAWIQHAAKRDKPILSLMSQVAISLLYDLGLHKTSTPCRSLVARFVRFQHPHQDQDPPLPPAPLEDRRAALACFLLTSVLSVSLRRIDSLRWTPRMEEHLNELAAHAESPLDHVLVTQVRLQRVADQMHHGDWQIGDPSISSTGSSGRRGAAESRPLPPYVIQILRAKINEIKASIPEEVAHHNGILGTLYTVETMLCASAIMHVQGGMNMPSSVPGAPPSGSGTTAGFSSSVDFARVANLERCVEAIATFWEFFRHIPNEDFCSLPFAFFAYFTHCIMLLYALSMVDEPAWDRAAIRERLHVVELLEGFANKLRSVPRHFLAISGTVDSHDVFQRAATMVSSVKDRWAADLTRAERAERAEATAAAAGAGGAEGGDTDAATQAETVPPGAPASAVPTSNDMASAWGSMVPPSDPMQIVSVPDAPQDLWGAPDGLSMETDPMLQGPIDPGMFFPDLLQIMGLSEDYLFTNAYMTMDNMMGGGQS